jgi:hypothetical protein
MRLKFAMVVLVGLHASARGALAQNCALCYTSASALGSGAQRSLDFGILTLVVPALVLFLTVIFMLYRRAVSATA